MAIDPRSAILQEMMGQLGGGMAPGGMPPGMPPGMPQGGMAPGGMSQGLPPEVMQLASLGIGPGDLQQGNAMPQRMPDRANTGEDVDPMESYGKPGDAEDPRFGPQDDPVRDETEGELDATRKEMMGEGEEDDLVGWEGEETPSEADLNYIKEHPTDGNLASFFKAFPTWTAEDILMQGGNPSESPDQYAMSDDEWEDTQRNRSTRIDER